MATGWTPVPTPTTLRRMGFGYDLVMADLMWVKGLQYYGRQRLAQAPMPRLGEYMDTAVALDPRFVAPYAFGGLVLIQDLDQPAAGVDLLLRGIAANPDRWELPFELGFLLLVCLEDPGRAARYFERASGLEGCPEMARRFAAWSYAQGGGREQARKVCEEILQLSDDETTRAFAAESLARIQIEEDLERIRAAIERHRERTGSRPATLKILIDRGDLRDVGPEPRGGAYVYRPETGEVASSSEIGITLDRSLRRLEDAVARYQAVAGVYPPSLEALVAEGLVDDVRCVFGFQFAYDADSGRIWIVDPWRT